MKTKTPEFLGGDQFENATWLKKLNETIDDAGRQIDDIRIEHPEESWLFAFNRFLFILETRAYNPRLEKALGREEYEAVLNQLQKLKERVSEESAKREHIITAPRELREELLQELKKIKRS
jgi:hypothetical protein